MSVVINTNGTAAVAANNLVYASSQLAKSLNRLSSGSKILNASDDAGGMAVAMKLTATANRDSDLLSNLSNVTSFVQTQDGALAVAGTVLDRMSQLTTLYADPTKNSSDLANYDDEFKQLNTELTTLGSQSFNGVSLFGTGSLKVATTDDLGTASAISVSQQNLVGTGGMTPYSANFSSLGGWTTTGTASVSGGSLLLSGSDVQSSATTTQNFTGPLEINMELLVPGTGDTFSISQGGQALATFVGGSSIVRNTWHSVKIDLDPSGTASTYLDGSSTPAQTQAGISLASGAIALADNGLGPARVSSLSVTGTDGASIMAAVTGASSLSDVSLAKVTAAIQQVASMRAVNGAEQSQLGFASAMITTNQTNLQSAVSVISDVDVAQESTKLAKWNVLVQAGTSMLAQANQSATQVLKLITG